MSYLFKINPSELEQLEDDTGLQFQYTTTISDIMSTNINYRHTANVSYITIVVNFPYVTFTIGFSDNSALFIDDGNLSQYTYGNVNYILFNSRTIPSSSTFIESFSRVKEDLKDTMDSLYQCDYMKTDRVSLFSNFNNLFILYNNVSTENTLWKELILRGWITGEYTNAFSLVTPVIDLEIDLTSVDFNYVYVKSLTRYYFVRSISSLSKNLTRFSFEEDVLMTFYDLIRMQNAIVSRNEYTYNQYLDDDERPLKTETKISYTEYTNMELSAQPSATTGYFYVLSVVK